MPKISIMTMVFGGYLAEGRVSDIEMLDALETMGFDGVEIPAGRILAQPALLRTYRSRMAGSRLYVSAIDAGCNLIGSDQAARDAGIEALSAAIDIAQALDCSLVLAAGSRLSAGIAPGDGRRMIADGLRACLPAAHAAGATLAIENFGVAPTLQCAGAHCLEVLDAVSELAFVFDTGNFYFCGEDPLANIELLAHRTRHMHIKDWVKSERPEIADVAGASLGTGFIPNQEVVRRFLALGTVDSFSIELGAPGDKFEAARHDLDTVRQWIESYNGKKTATEAVASGKAD